MNTMSSPYSVAVQFVDKVTVDELAKVRVSSEILLSDIPIHGSICIFLYYSV